jgi:ribosome maturation factor RimP
MSLLASPSQIFPDIQAQMLEKFRECLSKCAAESPMVADVIVRDWDFASVDGVLTVQVFLDRGLKHPKDGRMASLLLDECAAIHRHFLNSGIFDVFADNLAIEVGSAGVNPRLRTPADFGIMVGCWVSIETWQRIENRKKYVMIIGEVQGEAEHSALVLCEGEHRFLVPVSSIRRAEALLDRGLPGEKPRKKGVRA